MGIIIVFVFLVLVFCHFFSVIPMLPSIFVHVVKRSCSKSAAVLGVPFSKGQKRGGVENGPKTLRSFGLEKALQKYAKVTDVGDIEVRTYEEPLDTPIKNPVAVGQTCLTLSNDVCRNLEQFRPVINIGGDHSMAIGTISGTAKYLEKSPAVLWVDAHADINPPLLSPSGNLHGTPMSFLLKELHSEMAPVPGFDWLKRCVGAGDIAYIGLRDMDEAEIDIIRRFGIEAHDMASLDKLGIEEVFRRCMAKIDPGNEREIHLSFDIDAMDPCLAPATGTPVRGGLFRVEGEYICQELAKTNRLVCMDMVEVNPILSDSEGIESTAEMAISLIQFALGRPASGKMFKRPFPYVPGGVRNVPK